MAHILIIEPDRILGKTYAGALQSAGHQVVVCASAQQGVLAADPKRPDLILLELQLIEHSGIEFLYELRSYQDWQSIPVLIHTGVPVGEFADNLELLKQELLVAEYLYKPVTSLRRLLKTVNAYAPVPA
jgi:two-component system OmpR family response regulator